jgi:hypothetical protein
LKGKFYAFDSLTDDARRLLTEAALMFDDDDTVLKAAQVLRFWPTGRGVFTNDTKSFSILCNQEDHMKFIAVDLNGDLSTIAFDTFRIEQISIQSKK